MRPHLMTQPYLATLLALSLVCWSSPPRVQAEEAASSRAEATTPSANDTIMLTIHLRHDQSRPLADLNAQLQKQGFFKAFPPPGVEVVSWNVVMGIGQVVTLRLPASRLREVNRIVEDTAWGAFRTEFFATYDYKAIGLSLHDKAK